MNTRDTRRTLARLLVALYPPRWRRRYGFEVEDALEHRPISWADLADLLRCGIEEWLRGPASSAASPVVRRIGRLTVAATAGAVAVIASIVVARVLFAITVVAIRVADDLGGAFDAATLFAGFWRIAFAFRLDVVGLVVWLGYSIALSLPVAVCFAGAGAGRRWPVVARLATAAAFASFTAWAGFGPPVPTETLRTVVAAFAGFAFATVLFPKSSPVPILPELASDRFTEADGPEPSSANRTPRLLRAATT